MDDIPKIAGIYKLTCLNNGKIYIGKSINLNTRLRVYMKCKDGIGPYLKNAIVKHGWDSFKVEILETFQSFDKAKDNDSLLEREAYYIKLYNSITPSVGYNICEHSWDKTGTKHSEETKAKLRISNSVPRKPLSEEHKKNLSKAGKGRILTPEHKEKLRISALKRGMPREVIEKAKQFNTGRKASEETKAKLRNKKLSPEHKEALRKSHIGVKHTKETKEKMRSSALNRGGKV
jgi:group I intron endonuclease